VKLTPPRESQTTIAVAARTERWRWNLVLPFKKTRATVAVVFNDKPTLLTALARGWRRQCPRCGKGAIFRKWLAVNDRCSECGWQFLRDQGDLWGYLLLIDRALFIFPIVVVLFFRIHDPRSVWFYAFLAGILALLIGTMPNRNGLCIGLDYFIRTCGVHKE
jgi:uncharacterized protein (DUF983 family)